MERDNFYILLELPFEPPATDPAQIKAAIHQKHQQWTQQLDDPELRGVSLQYLELLPKMEETMLEEASRAQEAEQARALRETMFTRFTAELKVLEAKGYLLPRELSNLTKKYFPFGINRNDIHKELSAPVTDTPPKTAAESALRALPQDKMRSIRNNLKILGTKDLYTFLEVADSDSRDVVLAAANAKHEQSYQTADRSAETFAAQILAESAKTLFAEDGLREEYNLGRTVSQYPELNDLIDDEYKRAGFVSSEALVRMVNFGVASYSDSVLQVEDYIRRYCAAYGISVDFMHHHIQCPKCNEMNPGTATVCTKCAAPLSGTCPVCGGPFSDGESVCSHCGFLLGKMGNALDQFAIAEEAIIEGAWSAAQRALEHAATFWPQHPKLVLLQEKIDELESRNIDFMQRVADYLEEKRYYAALTLMEEAQNHQIRFPSTTQKHVEETISDFERNISALREQGNANYEALHDMLSYVADSIDLERMLAGYPPKPPSRITVVQTKEGVQIDWNASKSSGVIRYILVRKENSVPITAYDGDVLYEGTDHAFLDTGTPPLRNYYYSVFVKRGQSFSDIGAVSPVPVQIVPELSNLRILPADGGAQITWDALPSLQSVNIWRKLGGDAPTAPDEGMALENDRLDGFTDMKLRNDVDYWYYINATYSAGDSTVTSRGISQKVRPQALVSPLDHLTIVPATDGVASYVAQWQTVEDHDVMLLLSDQKPSYYVGEVVKVADLLFTHRRLDLASQTATGVRFSHEFTGGTYVFPVSVQGKIAVVGKAIYLTNIPNVTQPAATVVGENVYLSAQWPEGPIGEIIVAWKFGEFPTSLKEDGITTVRCTRRQYNIDHGVQLAGLGKGVYYFTLFTAFETPDGSILYSTGEHLRLNNTPPQELRYDVKQSKAFFSSQYTTTITIRSDDEFVIPKAVLVGKEGQMPLRITDGTPYFDVESDQPITGSVGFEYKSEKLPDDLYLRLFFLDAEMYKSFRPLPEKTVKIKK